MRTVVLAGRLSAFYAGREMHERLRSAIRWHRWRREQLVFEYFER